MHIFNIGIPAIYLSFCDLRETMAKIQKKKKKKKKNKKGFIKKRFKFQSNTGLKIIKSVHLYSKKYTWCMNINVDSS